MSLVKWAFVALLLLPAAEIGVLILVALLIGWLWTIALFLATSAAGVFLLRRSGRSDLDRAPRRVRPRMVSARCIWRRPASATMLGGILLVFPGFITDLLGVALLRPADFGAGPAADWQKPPGSADAPRPATIAVIDLEPDEWQQIPDPAAQGRPNARNRRQVARRERARNLVRSGPLC